MNGRENTYVKQRAGAPSGFVATEAAGLRWLAAASADGGVGVVEVLDQDATSVTLERLDEARPSDGVDAAAARFGAALAATHAAGAPTFGALPPGASTYFFGPLDQPLTLPHVESATFGAFYTQARLRPVLERTRLAGRDADLAQRVCGAVESGAVDTWGASGEFMRPARVHGDLWSGNVLWTRGGAVVIDPAACGHHPLADLAMLTMFGAPGLEAILDSYAEAAHLPDDWREQLPLHQLFGWLVHLHLFGAGYAEPVSRALGASARLLGV